VSVCVCVSRGPIMRLSIINARDYVRVCTISAYKTGALPLNGKSLQITSTVRAYCVHPERL